MQSNADAVAKNDEAVGSRPGNRMSLVNTDLLRTLPPFHPVAQGFFRIIKNQGGGGTLPQNPLPPLPRPK